MHKLTLPVTIFLLGIFFLVISDWAEAGRLGGSKSFGSKPSYSQNYQKPASPMTPPPPPSNSAQPGLGNRGMFGGFGGMLGGMLMGGLLGSLFFGGPFSGPSLIDLLLIGGGLFLLFRIMRSRQPVLQTPQHAPNQPPYQTRSGSWDHMRSATSTPPTPPSANVPADFDTNEFLDGAKAAYTHLQKAWDARKLDEIRHFTSDEVYAEIAAQAAADPKPGLTEILLLEAKLLEVKRVGNQTVATVLFDTMLREDQAAAQPSQVREAWHFSRYESGGKEHWVVEGIQQLAQ